MEKQKEMDWKALALKLMVGHKVLVTLPDGNGKPYYWEREVQAVADDGRAIRLGGGWYDMSNVTICDVLD